MSDIFLEEKGWKGVRGFRRGRKVNVANFLIIIKY